MQDREPSWSDDEPGRAAGSETNWWEGDQQAETQGEPEPREVRVPIRDQDTVILDRPPGWSDSDETAGSLQTQSEQGEPPASESPEISSLSTLRAAVEKMRGSKERVDSANEALEAAREAVVRGERELAIAQAASEYEEQNLKAAFVRAMTDQGLGYMKPHSVDGVITMDDVPVIRSNGAIEEGWTAQLLGDCIVCTKELDGDDFQKEISIEDWFEAPKRIGEAYKATLDRLVAVYPEVWEMIGPDAYQASSVYLRDVDTGGYRVGQVRIQTNNNLAVPMYPHDTSKEKTVLQYISIPTFMRWQQEGDAARLAQGELG